MYDDTKGFSFTDQYNRYVHLLNSEFNKSINDSSFLIKDNNQNKKNPYQRKSKKYDIIPINLNKRSSFNLLDKPFSKTQNKFCSINPDFRLSHCELNIENKKNKLISQNYKVILDDLMEKDIKTYPYGVNLNISNYETHEPIKELKKNYICKNENISKNKNGIRKLIRAKSFIDLNSNYLTKYGNFKKNRDNSTNNIRQTSLIDDNQRKKYILNKHQIFHNDDGYSKTCENFFEIKDRLKYNLCDINNKQVKNTYKNDNIINNIKYLINKIEEYLILKLRTFFNFFIRKLKYFIVDNIIKKKNSVTLIKQNNPNKFISYIMTFNNHLTLYPKDISPCKNGMTSINRNINNLKKSIILNNAKKIQIYQNSRDKSKFNILSVNKQQVSNQNSEQSLSTNFKSNQKSNLQISNNVSNISLIKKPNKDSNKTIHIFNKENYFNKIKKKIFNDNKNIIYSKPKIEYCQTESIIEIKRKNNKNNINKKNINFESSIKSIIINKENIRKLLKNSSLGNKKDIKKFSDTLSEIIIKDLSTSDKKIHITIKYLISEKASKDFTKAKIRRKLLSLKKNKNIFLNNDIKLLKIEKKDSFELGPVLIVLKTNIENRENIENKKIIKMCNILNSFYQKYIKYLSQFFLNKFRSCYFNLIDINLSCISDSIIKNNENDNIVEDDYSMINEKYITDKIDKIIVSDNIENNNINKAIEKNIIFKIGLNKHMLEKKIKDFRFNLINFFAFRKQNGVYEDN